MFLEISMIPLAMHKSMRANTCERLWFYMTSYEDDCSSEDLD